MQTDMFEMVGKWN